MERDTAVEIMTSVAVIEKLLDECPHGIAKKIKAQMNVFEQAADDAFPGGYHCDCIMCDAPMGHDESVAVGEEHICPACWEKRKAEIAACSHEHKPDTDEYGEPIELCHKCGHVAVAA